MWYLLGPSLPAALKLSNRSSQTRCPMPRRVHQDISRFVRARQLVPPRVRPNSSWLSHSSCRMPIRVHPNNSTCIWARHQNAASVCANSNTPCQTVLFLRHPSLCPDSSGSLTTRPLTTRPLTTRPLTTRQQHSA